MGGFGSGWKWASKTQVERCLILSAARLQNGGTLPPNQTVRGTLTWHNDHERVIGVFGFEARLKETEGEFEPIEPGLQWGSYFISFVTRPLPWGGLRWWFLCPLRGTYGNGCRRRVGKLYLPPGGNTFGCRHCYDLSYWSRQTSSREDRLWKADLRLMRKIERMDRQRRT